MGITIHYSLQSDAPATEKAIQLLNRLRARAVDLPFSEVGAVVELQGDDCDFETAERLSARRQLLKQARRYVEQDGIDFRVLPTHVIAFCTSPGDGCEHASFGLCRYPDAVKFGDRVYRTGLTGWSWRTYCKTQYSSNPECGGVQNFLRCHLAVVSLLDHAAQLGMLQSVSDEGGFWRGRDIEALTKEVAEWNTSIAGTVGQLKEEFGEKFVAEITKFPNFEHLEARGREEPRG